ncbi:hypothetical protein [Streptomyces sp. NPDC097619]|uniref:hypothetical protein n=1 Tax=Streptomyces sp. NPDC097619 TaxID=3157228 RepID=UPI00333343B4
MTLLAAVLALVLTGVVLWRTVAVARMRELPAWRRALPLVLCLAALVASLLRAFDIRAVADAVAFPLNLAALVLASREIRAADRARRETATPARAEGAVGPRRATPPPPPGRPG